MFKAIILASCLSVMTFNFAFSEEQCPLRNWAEIQKNLEFTANNAGPNNRGCAEVRVHSGETALDAFKHCNNSLSNPNGGIIHSSSMYNDCRQQACA